VTALLLVLVLVFVVVAMVWANRAQADAARLAREVNALQVQLDALRASLTGIQPTRVPEAPPATPSPIVVPPIEPPVARAPVPLPPPLPSPPPIAPASTLTLEERIGARWTTILGAVVLLLATGFFFRWSFQRGLIGPPARVVLGLLSGMAMLLGGVLLRRRRDLAYLSIGMAGFGLGALYLSLYAAHAGYALISPSAAFVGMALATVAGAAVSVWSRQQVTAVLAVLGGLLTPILVSTEHPDERILLAYLILLDLLALAVARFRDWAELNRLAWAGSVLLLLPSLLAHPRAEHPVARLLLLTLLFSVFFVVPLLRAWSERRPVGRLDLTLVLSNAAAYVAAVYVTLEHWRPGLEGPAAWALAAVYLIAGARFRARVPEDEATETAHFGAAATLLAAGVVLMLDGPWVTLAWAVQGVALVVLATRVRSLAALAGGPILLCLAAARAAWLDRFWYPAEVPFANVAFAVHACVVAALAIAGAVAARVQAEGTDAKVLRGLFWLTATALVTVLLWNEPPRGLWPGVLLMAALLGVAALARALPEPSLLAGTALLAAAVLVRLLLADWDFAHRAAQEALWNRWLLARVAGSAAVALAGALVRPRARVAASALHAVAGGALLLVLSLGWYGHQGWRARDAAGDAETAQRARWLGQVGLSVLWTLYAAGLLAFGFLRAAALVRYAGLGLLGIVFLKVMVVDLSRLDAIYRILSFAVLGVVLFGVAYFYQRSQNRRAPAPSP
jgi:uncharacterized membrane protein